MIAILVACTGSDFDLRGVTTVGGNAGIETTTRNARAILALAGRGDVPVAAGAARSLVRQAERFAPHVHGENGLGGVQLPDPPGPADPRHAVELLAEVLSGAEAPVTLVATGPLTNIALLFAVYPELASTVDRLVVMGGAIGAGNITAAAEFNIWFDPEAAHRVLAETDLPVTMVGLDVTMHTTLSPQHVEAIRGAGRVGALAAEALDYYQERYLSNVGRAIVPVHDAVAVVAATRPELITLRPATITVDTGYGPSRGNTLVDFGAEKPTAAVAMDADHDAVLTHIVERLATLDI
jgi:pyrimidine-specific ribonucleoside hydrolase